MVALDASQEPAGLEDPTALPRQNEGEVFPQVLVAVLQTRAPHHDAVVEQGAVAFLQGMHLLHHVGVLVDVELINRRHFPDLFLILAVVRLRVVLVGESQLGVGCPVWPRANVGADTCGIGLEGEDG